MNDFRDLYDVLDKCCQLALRQPSPDKKLVLMVDASSHAAGCAVLTEDDPNQKITLTRKNYAPIAYGSKTFTPSQIRMSIHARDVLTIYLAFKDFGHTFLGTLKPNIITTDSK